MNSTGKKFFVESIDINNEVSESFSIHIDFQLPKLIIYKILLAS